MSSIDDPDVQILADRAQMLKSDYPDNDDWKDSPFAWIKQRPSRQVGAIGEQLVSGWLATKNFTVGPSPDSQADRIVNTHRVEVKFSTRWKNGTYTFQQLRDQNYDFVICLGICPFDAHCWAIPKTEILRRWHARDGIKSQHGGRTGIDTAWLSFKVDDSPVWLDAYGGSLAQAAAQILRLTSSQP